MRARAPKIGSVDCQATLVTYAPINESLLALDRVLEFLTNVQDQRTAFPHRKWGV